MHTRTQARADLCAPGESVRPGVQAPKVGALAARRALIHDQPLEIPERGRRRLALSLAALARNVLWVYALGGTGASWRTTNQRLWTTKRTSLRRDADDEWPELSPLELAVCLADGQTRPSEQALDATPPAA